MTGINPGKYPGMARSVSPAPSGGVPGTWYDGQRLAGMSGPLPDVTWHGNGTPLYPPNHVGALSFYFKRGNVPFVNSPFMGIDFLGGPRLDLDGDPNDASRSLTPVSGQTPAEIPGLPSFIGLTFDLAGGTVTLDDFDATGTNEGAPNLNPGVGTTVNVLADGAHNGAPPGPINPDFDARVGTVTAFTGTGGGLSGVHRITGLNVEFWYDSIDPFSGTADELGTFQHFQRFAGWLVRRDAGSGQFPTLAGQGLGATGWPTIDMAAVGQTFNTAFDAGFGTTADIFDGVPSDRYSLVGQLGVPLTEFGGDLGAYFDGVVVPNLPGNATAFVYLESSGFGINNSGDPVFGDTNGYDMVIVAAAVPLVGDVNGDGVVDAADAAALAATLLDPTAVPAGWRVRADVNGDGRTNGGDIQALLAVLL